jgi:hypothetical protein
MQRIINLLFGCTHSHKSRVFGGERRGFYQTCLECGKELPYNYQEMRPMKRTESKDSLMDNTK